MKPRLSFVFLLVAMVLTTFLPGARAYACHCGEPLVSTQWLAHHLGRPNLVVVDIRSSDEYAVGHIPDSVSIPFAMPTSAWVAARDGLLMELPVQAELFAALGAAGISAHSRVVLVNNATSPGVPPAYPLAQTARVAVTLVYAGVQRVSILDGGITKWSLEGRALSTDPVTPAPVTFQGQVMQNMFVSKQYVSDSIGKANTVLLDARDADVYYGNVIEPFAPREGHIPTAKSLPAPSIWNDDGTYKSESELRALVTGVLGSGRSKEIVVYCGVGGYASPWWFVLTRVLGYTNVKFYDGSAQEWTADPNAPMVAFAWE